MSKYFEQLGIEIDSQVTRLRFGFVIEFDTARIDFDIERLVNTLQEMGFAHSSCDFDVLVRELNVSVRKRINLYDRLMDVIRSQRCVKRKPKSKREGV